MAAEGNNPIPTLDQNVIIEDPKSNQLGLEKFYQYVGKNTGAGSTAMVNLYSGNTVFGYDPIHNPGQGLSTFVRLTYNSLDTSDSILGYGWSLSATSPMRLGTALDLHPIKIDEITGRVRSGKATLIDGDGTSHEFPFDSKTGEFKKPAGVNLYLQLHNAGSTDRKWVMTRPDRTQFYFDDQGYLSAIVDKNQNELLFTYEERNSNNKPTKFLKYITDPAERQTLHLDYYSKSDTNNPKIIDKVKSITDISGRKITFTYSDKGLLTKFVDGAGDSEAKTFQFLYDATNANKNTKMVKITDPRGHDTHLTYYEAPEDPDHKWKLKELTDRLDGATRIAYVDADGSQGSEMEVTVTDAKNRKTKYQMNGYGNPTQITNAKNEVTELHWDANNNVDRLKEANGAVTTWTYDKNGLPLTQTDAVNNAISDPDKRKSLQMEYKYSLNGYVADLVKKTSPEGRTHTFTYDDQGNLLKVVDPKGNATSNPDDYTTRYSYHKKEDKITGLLHKVTDANGNVTTYGDAKAADFAYDPNGYPEKITDALGNTTSTDYGDRGEVLSITDAKGKKSTYTYDVFNRPLTSKVPKDQEKEVYIETPAPVYDKNDNVTKATAPNGAVSTYTYDKADQMITSVDPKDTATSDERKTTYEYDIVGNLKQQTEPKGNLTTGNPDDFVTSYAYDAIDQLTTVTNSKGEKITYSYDNVGNMVKMIEPKGNKSSNPDDYATKYTYDKNHRVSKETDAKGHSVQYTYDHDSNQIGVTDKEGTKTEILYDERGLVKEVRVPHKKDASGNTVYRVTKYEYDQVGNQTKEISPRGTETVTADDFTKETVYDALNRPKEIIYPRDPGSSDPRYQATHKMTYTYDKVGNVVKVSNPPSEGQTVRNDTVYTHFDNGWIKSSTDPWDIQTTYDYNELGLQTKRTFTSSGGSSSRTMGWSYYPDGKLKARSDKGIPVGKDVVLVDNTDTQNIETKGTWDQGDDQSGYHGYDFSFSRTGSGDKEFKWILNIPTDGEYTVYVKYTSYTDRATNAPYTIEHADGTTAKRVNQQEKGGEWVDIGKYSFRSDRTWSISLTDDADHTYVVADAVKLVRDNSGETENQDKQFEYVYDANGNLIEMTDGSTGAKVDSYAMTFNELNQVSKVEEKKGNKIQRTTSYTYDANGNPEKRAYDGEITEYTYDQRNLVNKVTYKEKADDPKPKITTYQYTPNGLKKQETKVNGNTVDYTYYLDQLMKHQVEKKSNGTIVNEHTLGYNANGHTS